MGHTYFAVISRNLNEIRSCLSLTLSSVPLLGDVVNLQFSSLQKQTP